MSPLDSDLILWSLPGFAIALLMFGYVAYNFTRGGIHVKGKGWMSKEDAPKSYYFTQIIMIVLGIFQIASGFVRIFV